MFKAQRNGKSPSSGEKVDFKFSNFQALQVPKVWDKLLVSIICVETGKTIARSNKALVRNGTCQWTETLSESIWIRHHNSSKELEEHLFKFVVSMGSVRSGILGEATVNTARYYTSSRSSSPVSLPLKKCNYGTILQVKIQCLTPRTKLKYMFVDDDYDHAGSRSNESSASLNPKSISPSCQDLAPTSLLEQMNIMETSSESSGPNQNNDSAEYSLEKKKFYHKSNINGIKHNIDAESKSSCPVEENVYVSKSKSSLKSRITEDDKEQGYNGSSAPAPPSSSVMNAGSSKNLLDAAEETIEELRDEARTWERKSQKLTIGLDILKEKYSNQSKTLAESQMEISSAMAERDDIKKEADHIKMLLEESIIKHKASRESKSTYNSKGQSQLLKELENELKAHKESNTDLAQQLKKSQESNIELVCILQELEETTEKQRTKIEELQVVKSKLTELEKSFNSNSVETRSLQLKLQQMEESERTLQSNKQILEQALENEQISNSQTRSDLEVEYKTTLSAKEEYIQNLESKLSEVKEIEKDQMREIEWLKMKVSEVENDCNELTNENLELVCELKETKKVIQERNKTIEENNKLLEDCGLKIQQLESQKVEQEARISDLDKEKEELQDRIKNSLNESNIATICLDSQVSANKLLEEKAMKLEKVKCEMELCLFEMEEENIKLLERVSELENQLMRVKDEHEMTRLELEKSEFEKLDLQNEVNNLQDVEKLLLIAQEECEYVKAEKQKLQESAENLIEECKTLQKSYEDMTKGNAELYDQYSSLVLELTSETQKNQKEVERLKNEISQLHEQKSKLTSEKSNLESSLKEDHSRTERIEIKIQTVREESERKIQDLTTELAAIKQNHKKLMADNEKKSKLLNSYRIREERKGTMENNLELKLTVSEHERQQLIEEAAYLKDEVLDYKQKLEKLKNEKSNLEASLYSVSNSFEKLKAEKLSFFNKMSEFEDCKSQRDALEEKLSRLEGNLTARNESRSQNADMKNEISRIKSANLQYRLKIQQLEGEKKECLKKIEDLQQLSAKSETGVHDHETRSREDNDYAAKVKILEAELDEALNANHKYRVQLQKLKSKGRNSLSSEKSKVEGEVVMKELFEKTQSSLEIELKDLRDRYLEMSLKYAQVEAERGDLVMQLKTNSAKKRSQLLENP